MNWLDLKRGDVLIDAGKSKFRESMGALLILSPPTEDSNMLEWFSLVSGKYYFENMISTFGTIEADGWILVRSP